MVSGERIFELQWQGLGKPKTIKSHILYTLLPYNPNFPREGAVNGRRRRYIPTKGANSEPYEVNSGPS